MRIFLCGDVMLGRGIDQALPFPSKPQLYESFIKDAGDYLFLAEKRNGKIPYPVAMNYIWGDALLVWEQYKPTLKIINLENAITNSDSPWPNKAIHYRMSPHNIETLQKAGIDICSVANNHILDWEYEGLNETLTVLQKAHIQYSGAGNTITQAVKPAVFQLANGKRILVFSLGTDSSGIPSSWEAHNTKPGLYYIEKINISALHQVVTTIQSYKKEDDFVILSIHWGSNWGYDIPDAFRLFAHGLIDALAVDLLFGHSSHHPRDIEIYKNKPILYGCGDFINDYEGISGHEAYRGNLSLMYFLDFDEASLEFKQLILVPLQIKNFRLQLATSDDRQWLLTTFNKHHNAPYTLYNSSLQELDPRLMNIPIFILK